jgi:hypothetical protein
MARVPRSHQRTAQYRRRMAPDYIYRIESCRKTALEDIQLTPCTLIADMAHPIRFS